MNQKPCILYIDDDNENLIGFEAILNYNFEIFTSSEIAEVDKILQNHPIEVIVLDYKMPEKTGIELVDHLFQSYPEIIYIITSAYADIDIVTEAINHHEIYGFIPKPWNLQELKLIIKNAAQFHATKQQNKRLAQELKENNELLANAIQNEKRANALKSLFLKNISHEIRTPLNAIVGFNQIVISASKDKKAIEMLNYSLQGCYDLLNVMNNIISASKIISNQVTYYKREFSIHELIENAISRQMISKDNLHVKTRIPDDLFVNSDPSALSESVSCIIDNAVKFSQKGMLEVYSEINGTNLKIHFKDNGPGIDKASLDQIFESFRQEDETDARKYGGVGLGLFIAQNHIKNLNGSLVVETAKGKGADFIITLPPSVISLS